MSLPSLRVLDKALLKSDRPTAWAVRGIDSHWWCNSAPLVGPAVLEGVMHELRWVKIEISEARDVLACRSSRERRVTIEIGEREVAYDIEPTSYEPPHARVPSDR